MNYTRITFKQHEPPAQDAPQGTPNAPQADSCADKGDGLLRNTSDSEAGGGGQGVWGAKKVLRQLVARYHALRSNGKTKHPIRHRGQQ